MSSALVPLSSSSRALHCARGMPISALLVLAGAFQLAQLSTKGSGETITANCGLMSFGPKRTLVLPFSGMRSAGIGIRVFQPVGDAGLTRIAPPYTRSPGITSVISKRHQAYS